MITVCKVSTKINFQENEVMSLLHGALQFYCEKIAIWCVQLLVYEWLGLKDIKL